MSYSYSEIFRPKKPKQLIGDTQKRVAEALIKKVEDKSIVQEVLFSGPSGVGKTTIAKMYLSAVLGYEYEEEPFNCGDKTGVDYIREQVIATMNYMPLDSKYRVYFLDEIHMLSTQAQNSLLVAIEPVPKHVLFICCTTAPEKLIPTLRSRLTEYHLLCPTIKDFRQLAVWIYKKEEKTISDEMRDEIIGLANGNVRQFVRYLQQALDGSYTGIQDQINKEHNLAGLIIKNSPLSTVFKAIEPSTDYVKEAIGLSRYAIAILKNPQSNPQVVTTARAILKVFGNQPTRQVDGDTTFFCKLLEVYEAIKK